jgi:hypothetical protein
MCRKLETEQEKVLPFYSSFLTEEEDEQAKAAQLEEPTESLAKVHQQLFYGREKGGRDREGMGEVEKGRDEVGRVEEE